jgi:hypothetical protein
MPEQLRNFDPLWVASGGNVNENHVVKHYVRHGGWGPVPGSPEGKKAGCICSGAEGRAEGAGFSERSDCQLHGNKARKENYARVRAEMARNWARLDAEEERNDGPKRGCELAGDGGREH